MLTAHDIPWQLPPVDRLMMDDAERREADLLRLAIEQIRTLTVRCQRLQRQARERAGQAA
jgi:hypothetical protein